MLPRAATPSRSRSAPVVGRLLGEVPVLTVVGLQFGALLAGAIVTETIFSWPGIGRLTIQAIGNRDYYLVQGCVLAIGLTYIAVNFLTDLTYSLANPRIRQ